MSCTIYWFSGTGNSRAVANSLHDAIPESELVWMGGVTAGTTCESELVGFVFPVYAFGIPNLVARTIETLELPPDAYIFSVATMASTPGVCHRRIRDILRQKGHTLAAGWSIRMPGNYTPLREPPDENKQQALFTAAEERVRAIAAIIAEKKQAPLEDSHPPLRWIAAPVARLSARHLPTQDKKFHLPEPCSTCGTCVRVCPVGNIVFKNDALRWLGKCEQCFACLQWCPVEAIEWGRWTAGRRRYHHPAFKAGDFFLRALEDTEPPAPSPGRDPETSSSDDDEKPEENDHDR